MAKKLVKIICCLLGVTGVILGVFFFLKKRNNKKTPSEAPSADAHDDEEHLNAEDALDLSSLKFSRHYVDLR